MRNWLLIGASTLAFTVGHPAHAQIPVTDGGVILGQAQALLQQLRSYASELQMIQNQIQQIQWAATLATNFIHNPAGSITGLMALAGVSPNLPINPYAVQSLLSGYGGIGSVGGLVGKLGTIGSLVNTSYTHDQIYNCTDHSFTCQQMQSTAVSNASLKGLMSQAYSDLNTHLTTLAGLRAAANSASDPKTVLDAQAGIQSEQAWVQNEGVQVQTIAAIAQAQQQVTAEQANEKTASDIAAVLASAPK